MVSSMSEQPKHCEHECCPVERRRAGKGDDGVIRCYPREKCLHDTRSRPHPAPQAQQRIDAVIKELEKALESAYYEENDAHIREAIALLQEGPRK